MKPIKGYENSYLINEKGEIYSLLSGRFLKTRVNKNGYEDINLQDTCTGQKKRWLVHRLMAINFLELEGSTKKYVNHINGNKKDNHLNNLELCTRKENQLHMYRLYPSLQKGENNNAAKWTDLDIKTILFLKKEGKTQKFISGVLKIPLITVARVMQGNHYRCRDEF